jgi:hypothetical protein
MYPAKVLRLCAAVALIMGCHLVIEFVAWSLAIRNPVAWKIVSFPIFAIADVDFSTRYFWVLLVANSAIWAVLVIALRIWRARMRAR